MSRPTASLSKGFMEFTEAGGELGRLMRSVDWRKSSVGPFESWPQSLKTALSICLGSRFPMLIWWGRDLTVFYNDAYIPFAAPAKHPQFLGRSAKEQWAEIWGELGPLTEEVFRTGKATWAESMQLFMSRKDFLEETYFTFSYSPIRDESGAVGGIINPCQETTDRVLGERRLKTLHDLGADKINSFSELGNSVGKVLGDNINDVPFSLIYLSNTVDRKFTLIGSSGIKAGSEASPLTLDLMAPDDQSWPIHLVDQSKQARRVDSLRTRFPNALPRSPYAEGPDSAYILPIDIAGQEALAGFLILGISSRLSFGERYREFFALVSKHLSTHISNIHTIEREKKRAEALAEIDRAKTLFFSNVSHEFRTPLTLMLGPLEDLLSGRRLLPSDFRVDIELLNRNALRLLKLVNTLLDFSRIEAGRMQASYQPTDISTLTADLASLFRSAIDRGGLEFVVDCPALSEPIYLDRDMWEKIVLNLISNAFKFTLKGKIRVQLTLKENGAELVISDSGIGIPEAELVRLFERFHRVEGARGRSFEGTGIGLALVKELVRLHGGTIAVESVLDQGTTFTVSMPRGMKHLPSHQVQNDNSSYISKKGGTFFVQETEHWNASVNEPVSSGERQMVNGGQSPLIHPRAKILLADDNSDMRDYMKRLLGEYWDIETVADGLSALSRARETFPDLIITDVMMPRLSGMELIQELKSGGDTKDIPVIMISARAGEEARVEGFQKGADDYLVKPFSAKELIARTSAILENNRQTMESLRIKNHALARANVELEQFAWISSHDLKEPIRTINLYCEVFAEQVGTAISPEAKETLNILKEGASRMEILVEGLRTYALSRGEEISPDTVDCNQVISQVLINLKVLIDQSQALIHIEPLPIVKGNFVGLVRVFQNLISNSIKFRGDLSLQIEIKAERRSTEWVFSVRDNGIGFEREYSDMIFLLGKRLHGQETHPGAGIGLAVCKSVVDCHGGSIWAESQPGKGAVFYLTLPMRDLAADVAIQTSQGTELPGR